MTKEEAREAVKEAYGNSEYTDEIIKALEQEPKPMIEIDLYSVIKQKYIEREVLDEIRAEIKAMSGDIETIADVLQIIDKYRTGSEGKK